MWVVVKKHFGITCRLHLQDPRNVGTQLPTFQTKEGLYHAAAEDWNSADLQAVKRKCLRAVTDISCPRINQIHKDLMFHFCRLRQSFTRSTSWLRHCVTSRKVASSIPDGFIGNFLWRNPSGRNMTLGSTQRPVRRADSLTTFMCRLSRNLGASTSWNPQGLSRYCYPFYIRELTDGFD
jgi:hypothetical protein